MPGRLGPFINVLVPLARKSLRRELFYFRKRKPQGKTSVGDPAWKRQDALLPLSPPLFRKALHGVS